MANNKLSIVNDILGVLRGVYMIHSHSSMLPTQRAITLQRQLTDNQRQQAQFD